MQLSDSSQASITILPRVGCSRLVHKWFIHGSYMVHTWFMHGSYMVHTWFIRFTTTCQQARSLHVTSPPMQLAKGLLQANAGTFFQTVVERQSQAHRPELKQNNGGGRQQETGEGRHHHWPIVSPIETLNPLGGGATKNETEKSYHEKAAWAAWDCQN